MSNVNFEKHVKFNDIGQQITLTLQTKYEDLEVFEFPTSCSKCPVGYGSNCGRNVPFKAEDYISRPKTCKLKKIDIFDALYSVNPKSLKG